MKILIAGASGYLGSKLVHFLSRDHDVIALLRSASCSDKLLGSDAKLVRYDNYQTLGHIFKNNKPDIVINTSALYGRKGEQCSDLVEANIIFPMKLLELSNKYKCTAFIQTGTSLPDNISPYSLTKNTFIKLVKTVSHNLKSFINIELEHFYGPDDDNSKFSSYIIDSCLNNKILELTSGEQRRDFIYIDDVVQAYNVLVDNINSLGGYETIPLGSGYAPTIRFFVETIHKCLDSTSILKFGSIPMRQNEVMFSCADITKLRNLGWSPKFELVDGINDLINKDRT